MDTLSYNIIFAGTPEFSVPVLSALIHSSHTIKAVYTQPDRPAGRGRKLTASPVKQLALLHDLPIYQPLSLRNVEEQQRLASLNADLMIVVAYGLILPLPVLQAPKLGCINIHASLLPYWRGAAPIQRAILAGDTLTGITIMQMDEGLDTGKMLHQQQCLIEAQDTSLTLHDRLAEMGVDALLTVLNDLPRFTPQAQDNALATYAHKITKDEAKLNWHLSAVELDRKIRAFMPWPIAFTHYADEVIRIWQADVIDTDATSSPPGSVISASSQGIDVATGCGVLRLKTLQFPGGRALSCADILNARQNIFSLGNILL